MNAFLKAVLIAILGLVGIVGLGMSLCGGMVTLSGLSSPSGRGGGEFGGSGMMIISIPSLVVGLLVCWAAFVGLRGLIRGRKPRDGGDDPR